MNTSSHLRPIALTMGEPSGIGPEICLKAWLDCHQKGDSFFLVGDIEEITRWNESLHLEVPIERIVKPAAAIEAFPHALPIVHEPMATKAVPGKPSPSNSAAIRRTIEQAVKAVLADQASAVVTSPIQKSTLQKSGFPHAGLTEYLGVLAGKNNSPVMMLMCQKLRVVPITTHVGLIEGARNLNSKEIIRQTSIVDTSLRYDFGIPSPKIAVAALNPHAGEEGQMGREEIEIISPAVQHSMRQGIDVVGPLPADSLFSEETRQKFDAFVCMYHDQALIPIKAIDFWNGVNITIGLPFIRTSPDHGTALDIVGLGKANPTSLLAALSIAKEIVNRRSEAAINVTG